MKRSLVVMVVAVAGLLAGCEGEGPAPGASIGTLSGPAVARDFDPERLARGEALFRRHCAGCHGERAEGDPQWRKIGPDGRYPPPPLDGSGHAWHHPRAWLERMIRDGSRPEGNMPGWGEVLSEEEIGAVVDWFQSLWPERVYATWHDMHQRR